MRNRQVSPPATACELDTGGNPLPCSLLALGLGEWKSAGPHSCFNGRLCAAQTPQGYGSRVFSWFGWRLILRRLAGGFEHDLVSKLVWVARTLR